MRITNKKFKFTIRKLTISGFPFSQKTKKQQKTSWEKEKTYSFGDDSKKFQKLFLRIVFGFVKRYLCIQKKKNIRQYTWNSTVCFLKKEEQNKAGSTE